MRCAGQGGMSAASRPASADGSSVGRVTGWGAIVLGGGTATRLGRGLKPTISVGGVRMIDRVLLAVTAARPVIVVGPEGLNLPASVMRVQETPPGGGPVCAVGAAMGCPSIDGVGLVVIIAGDLPLLGTAAVESLLAAVDDDSDGAIYVDGDDRPQWLCGAWRRAAISRRLDGVRAERGTLDSASLRGLFSPLRIRRIRHDGDGPPPYLDCDTDRDLHRAEEWLTR